MNLDRSLIKQQARTIIKNKVMKLFLTFFIVTLCASAVNITFSVVNNVYSTRYTNYYSDLFDNYDDYYDDDYYYGGGNSDFGYFDDFGTENGDSYDYGNDFYSFGAEIPMIKAQNPFTALAVANVFSLVSIAATVLLLPLTIALSYFFVEFIKGKEYELGAGITSVFTNAFKVDYGKKIALGLLKGVLMYVLTILFVIPGLIFNYSSYFAYELMCEYPNLSPWEAIKLSKKMIKGNRSELFVLDLSFIPWMFLCIFIFPIIYVVPYYWTTKALYYENFKLRALAMGRITEDDFLSEQEIYMKYMSQVQQGAGYSQNNGTSYNQGQTSQQGNTYTANQTQQGNPFTNGYTNPNGAGANPYTTGYANNYNAQNNASGFNNNQQAGNPNANMYNMFGAPVYYQPPANNTIIPPQQFTNDGSVPKRDIYSNMTSSTVSQDDAAGETAQPKPDFTVTEPQEPEFTQPVEPTEEFVEPTEPTAPEDFTQQADEPIVTEQTNEQTTPAEETVFTQQTDNSTVAEQTDNQPKADE